MSEASKDAVELRTSEAFARSGWEDPRPHLRALLRRLREHDADAFASALQEYEERVATRLADESVDPVAVWLDYGNRLATRVGGGRTMCIEGSGGSVAMEDFDVERPVLLLHMPADDNAPAIVVAAPRQPSSAQRATVMLLAERRQALSA